MKANVGGIDKMIRIVVGIALITWAAVFAGPVWAWIGVVPLLTGLFNYCPTYALFGCKSGCCKK
jgi:membrane-associated protease RseP (regulator of RpoE activity)